MLHLDSAALRKEPISISWRMQRLAWQHLLTKAVLGRLAWIAGFCLGPFGSNERTWKPFNPILGETFEVDRPNGVRFLAEQVRPRLVSCRSVLAQASARPGLVAATVQPHLCRLSAFCWWQRPKARCRNTVQVHGCPCTPGMAVVAVQHLHMNACIDCACCWSSSLGVSRTSSNLQEVWMQSIVRATLSWHFMHMVPGNAGSCGRSWSTVCSFQPPIFAAMDAKNHDDGALKCGWCVLLLSASLPDVQVSHHPPIAAAHAENKLWTYDIVSAPTTRFLGNSVEIFPVGACSHSCSHLPCRWGFTHLL